MKFSTALLMEDGGEGGFTPFHSSLLNHVPIHMSPPVPIGLNFTRSEKTDGRAGDNTGKNGSSFCLLKTTSNLLFSI